MYSAEQGYTNIVKLLLESGADTELQDSIGSTALMIASGKNNVEIVKLLLKHDVNVNKKDNYFNTALHYACRSGNQHIIHLLLENNAEVNISGSMGTPLNIVTFYREKELVKLLLQYGARS